MKFRLREEVSALPLSPTLRANQAAAARSGRGRPVLHMGFGQSPFPVHPRLEEALANAARHNGYENVAGLATLREQAGAYLAERLGLDASDYDCIVAPGSKLILYAMQMAIEGDLILPAPSWVSYEPQALMLGDRTHWLPAGLSDAGYRIDPGRLEALIIEARRCGRNPSKLILNSPNNPTGLILPPTDYSEIAAVCERNGIFIISDEIYALTAFDGTPTSIASVSPGNAAVTTGLSKHLSLGGWRIGFGLIPRAAEGLFDALNAIASETWSCVASPIQDAALVAVSGDPHIEAYVAQCTRIHAAVARYVATRIGTGGVVCARPQGAFYLWPDFSALRDRLGERGIDTSVQLADALLAEHDVLSLPGTAFGAPHGQLALRLSVCDYDGREALSACRDLEDPGPSIQSFAPKVVAATDAIGSFAQELPIL